MIVPLVNELPDLCLKTYGGIGRRFKLETLLWNATRISFAQ